MGELKVYLDSSAIVKRYVKEVGSDSIKAVYKKADASGALLAFSLWNIGEVLGTLDSYMKRKWINEHDFASALDSFAGETLRLARLMILFFCDSLFITSLKDSPSLFSLTSIS